MELTPSYVVVANGSDISAMIATRLVSMTLTDEAGLSSDTFEVTLADHDPLAPIAMPETGAELDVYMGYGGINQSMGLFVVDEIELSGWPSQMTIRAKAAPYSTSKGGKTDLQSQKSRSWPKDTKLADMVAKIAGEHGMGHVVAKSLSAITLPHYDQTEESDISFLVRVAKRYDAVVKPGGGKIIMAKRGESKSASGEALTGVVVHASADTRYSMTLAKRDSPGTVIAYVRKKREAKREEIKVGSGEPVRRLRHTYPTADSARAAAQAELDGRKRGESKLTLTMPGNPDVTAEAPLTALGFPAPVNGGWLVTRAVHTISASGGFSTDLDAEKPNDSE